MTGQTGYYAGLAAEDMVARLYAASGHRVLARRWRGKGGEVDLIVARDGCVVFVEVKKSRSIGAAAARLSARQIARLQMAAQEYLGAMPDGLNSEMRFDVACVDQTGRVEVIENAIWA